MLPLSVRITLGIFKGNKNYLCQEQQQGIDTAQAQYNF
jgi:hypothetical protein